MRQIVKQRLRLAESRQGSRRGIRNAKLTEEQGAELLAKHAPHWREHLHDDGLVMQIMSRLYPKGMPC